MATITKTYSDNLDIVTPSFTVGPSPVKFTPKAHDTAYSPAAMWQLDGNMTDLIGTNHLSVGTGTELYGYSYGLQGFACNGATRLDGSTNYTPLMVVGDLTVEMLLQPSRINSVYQNVVHESGQALESGPTNILWSLRLTATNGVLEWANEYTDSGTNSIYTSTIVPAVGALHHIAMTRESDVVKFYIDGALVATSPTQTTPTFSGTPLQRIEVGGNLGVSVYYQGFISSIKIIKSALTSTQILREANYCLYGGV